MKLLKKYLFILSIFTVFLLTPLSVQIQNNPIKIIQPHAKLEQKKYNETLFSVKISKAYAEKVDQTDGLLDCGTWTDLNISCHLVNFVNVITVNVGNYLVGIAAKFMDFFLSHSLQSASYNGSDFIKAGWEILRDITNIVFIFALLFIAFQLVLGSKKSNPKKYLIKVILVALTVNFSLFFSYAIIDASNIFAHVFYNKIDQNYVEFETQIESQNLSGGIDGKSTSLAIANKINPQKLFLAQPEMSKGEFMLMSVMAGVINGAMIYVFLSVAFLFLGRTLGLWIAAILSPLAFASLTVPKMENIEYVGFKKWFPSLLKMAFMAPVFIFILYLAVQFMNVYTIGGSPSTLQNMLDIVIPMAMITALLLIAKKIADKLSGDFAGVISGFVGKFVGGALAIGAIAATGGAAVASGIAGGATSGVGRIAKAVGKEEWGEKAIKRGQRMRDVKLLDVTKIPGFKKLASRSGVSKTTDYFSKNLAGESIRGTERRVDLGIRKGIEKGQDFLAGRDFTEAEHKFEQEKAKYQKEQDKRKKGAASWQENINKEIDIKQTKEDLKGMFTKERKLEKDAYIEMLSNPDKVKTEEKALKKLNEELSNLTSALSSAKGSNNNAAITKLESDIKNQKRVIEARKEGKEITINQAAQAAPSTDWATSNIGKSVDALKSRHEKIRQELQSKEIKEIQNKITKLSNEGKKNQANALAKKIDTLLSDSSKSKDLEKKD